MISNFKLSKYFSFKEMVNTSHTTLKKENMKQAIPFIWNMTRFCLDILDPARELLGILYVSSGFRCKGLNSAVKGSPTSQHLYGQAADVYHPEWTWDDVLANSKKLAKMYKSKEIGTKVIAEKSKTKVWIHISRFDVTVFYTGIEGKYVKQVI